MYKVISSSVNKSEKEIWVPSDKAIILSLISFFVVISSLAAWINSFTGAFNPVERPSSNSDSESSGLIYAVATAVTTAATNFLAAAGAALNNSGRSEIELSDVKDIALPLESLDRVLDTLDERFPGNSLNYSNWEEFSSRWINVGNDQLEFHVERQGLASLMSFPILLPEEYRKICSTMNMAQMGELGNLHYILENWALPLKATFQIQGKRSAFWDYSGGSVWFDYTRPSNFTEICFDLNDHSHMKLTQNGVTIASLPLNIADTNSTLQLKVGFLFYYDGWTTQSHKVQVKNVIAGHVEQPTPPVLSSTPESNLSQNSSSEPDWSFNSSLAFFIAAGLLVPALLIPVLVVLFWNYNRDGYQHLDEEGTVEEMSPILQEQPIDNPTRSLLDRTPKGPDWFFPGEEREASIEEL